VEAAGLEARSRPGDTSGPGRHRFRGLSWGRSRVTGIVDCRGSTGFDDPCDANVGYDDMQAALQLFDDLGIKTISAYYSKVGPGPLQTAAARVVARMIHKHGLPHATLVLRAITESSDANQHALIADIIEAVSDLIISHPRWANTGLALLEAFDSIDLVGIRKIAKDAKVRPLRAGIATLIAVELEKMLGPSKPARPSRPSKADIVSDRLALGAALIGPDVTAACERYNVDPVMSIAKRAMAAAKLYGDRPEITSRVSWSTLCELSRPALPRDLRRKFEAAIMAGQTVWATQIKRARQGSASRRQADQPARRMAA
jgi:hypothetical protein